MTESKALFTAGEVAGIVGGACRGNLDEQIVNVVVDSRAIVPGSLFVALPGDKVDGHDFIEAALKQGCSCIIASAARCQEILARVAAMQADIEADIQESARQTGTPAKAGVLARACLVFVDSPLRALQMLAKDYRQRMRNLFRIGVTGSSGKTTTKECIGATLAPAYPEGTLIMNAGNLNSDIGLSLSMFTIRPEHKIGVFEMGMNRVGEMDELDEIYEPDLAVITNIGTAHVGIIGSRQGIAQEKKNIFSRFNGKQIGLVWEDDSFRDFLKEKVRGRVTEFGLHSTIGLESAENLGLSGWQLRWMGQTILFPLPGRHNLNNALAALSVAVEMGAEPALAAQGLQAVKPLFGRSEIFEGSISLIRDCYNANPDSVAAALDFVDSVEWKGRKLCVLGSMLELGDSSVAEHRVIGRRA
ncbi:MAG: UDP-N-acetylmuramoyl-tripeptide--D-alanyl-D-alanine ligase, partial [Spirochaetaceae bacterium]|nr:UDP-N-acetylmuramoyl-tripeptide--D-alanyl-D-alanine ligase [Spirochaetaceae bacterium]